MLFPAAVPSDFWPYCPVLRRLWFGRRNASFLDFPHSPVQAQAIWASSEVIIQREKIIIYLSRTFLYYCCSNYQVLKILQIPCFYCCMYLGIDVIISKDQNKSIGTLLSSISKYFIFIWIYFNSLQKAYHSFNAQNIKNSQKNQNVRKTQKNVWFEKQRKLGFLQFAHSGSNFDLYFFNLSS